MNKNCVKLRDWVLMVSSQTGSTFLYLSHFPLNLRIVVPSIVHNRVGSVIGALIQSYC